MNQYLQFWCKDLYTRCNKMGEYNQERIAWYESLGIGLFSKDRTEDFRTLGEIIHINYRLEKLSELVIKRGKLKMASKKKSQTPMDWTLVNIELTNKEKEDFKAWFNSVQGTLEEVLVLPLHEGYKMSVSYSISNERYYATITQTDEDAPDGRTSQMSHANSLVKAMALAVWKWKMLGNGSLIERKGSANDFG